MTEEEMNNFNIPKSVLIKKCIQLEAQIEKMKCCEMCKHKNLNWGFSPICEARDRIKIENPLTCKCDKWELRR